MFLLNHLRAKITHPLTKKKRKNCIHIVSDILSHESDIFVFFSPFFLLKINVLCFFSELQTINTTGDGQERGELSNQKNPQKFKVNRL